MVDPDGKYETDGHFWTVYLMGTLMGLKNAFPIAYETEAPDNIMSRNGDVLSSPDTWLDPIWQFNVHALNGWPSSYTRNQAKSFVLGSSSPGQALHYFGDSYAHSIMGDEQYMYETGFGHLFDGHAPDKIANRPDLYLTYVKNLAQVMGSKFHFAGVIDLFTFNYIAGRTAGMKPGTTEENSAIFETEISIRQGLKRYDVAGDMGRAINWYIKQSNMHYGRNVTISTSIYTVTHMKKTSDGDWVEDSWEQRTLVTFQ